MPEKRKSENRSRVASLWTAVFIWVSVFLFTYLFILQVPGVVSKRYLLYALLIGLAAALLFWALSIFKGKRTAEDFWHSLQKHLLPVLVYTLAFLLLFNLPSNYLLAPAASVQVEIPPVEQGGKPLRLVGLSNGMQDVSFKDLTLENAEVEAGGITLNPGNGQAAMVAWQGSAWEHVRLQFEADQHGIPIHLKINGRSEVLNSQSGAFFAYLKLQDFARIQNLSWLSVLTVLICFLLSLRFIFGEIHAVCIYFMDTAKTGIWVTFKKIREFIKQNIEKPEWNPYPVWFFCIFLSAAYLLIATKSSPLYPFNDWVDANAFFTVGKGMMHGKIPYLDLFEKKGPLLYFLHGLAYLISNKSFLGVYFFEVISFSVFLFFSYKVMSLFIDKKYALLALPILSTQILNLKSFMHGDSAEEFCLPLLMISLYYLLKYFKEIYPEAVPARWVFWNGVIAGCVLWIKYTLLGFWLGWMASLFFCMLINQEYSKALKGCVVFLLGMFAATVPWIFYFGISHAIPEWIEAYVTLNLVNYRESASLLQGLEFTFTRLWQHIKVNPFFGHSIWIGILIFTFSKKYVKHLSHRLFLVLCVFLLVYGVYGGGRGFPYYFLFVSPIVIFWYIVVLNFINKKFGKLITAHAFLSILVMSLLVTIPFTLRFNHNVYMLDKPKDDLFQFRFAKIIRQVDGATLLNYGVGDVGLYTTTGIIPNIRYFQKYNFEYSMYPVDVDEQNRYIREELVDYVVLRIMAKDKDDQKYLRMNDSYTLIASHDQRFEDLDFTYLLYKKND